MKNVLQRNVLGSFNDKLTRIFAILGSGEIVVEVLLDGLRVSGFFFVRVNIVSDMYGEMSILRS